MQIASPEAFQISQPPPPPPPTVQMNFEQQWVAQQAHAAAEAAIVQAVTHQQMAAGYQQQAVAAQQQAAAMAQQFPQQMVPAQLQQQTLPVIASMPQQGSPGSISQPQQGQPMYGEPQQGSPAPPKSKASYVVATSGDDGQEVIVRTLVGEYREAGTNHDRKFFQKVIDKNAPDIVEVFMYYWDERDGPSFSGWWFGNKVGGTQVWSHCASVSDSPPECGWKIPWDSAVRKTFSVVSKATPQQLQMDKQVQATHAEANELDRQAMATLAEALAMTSDISNLQALSQAEEMVAAKVNLLQQAQAQLLEAQRTNSVSPTHAHHYGQLAMQLQQTASHISQEATRIQSARQISLGRLSRAEAEDDANFQPMKQECVMKVQICEEAVRRSKLSMNTLQEASSGDSTLVVGAIDKHETNVREAQKIISETRLFLNNRMGVAINFEPKSQYTATTAIGTMQARIKELQDTLNPLKNARKELCARQSAKKVLIESEEKLRPAEEAVDAAEACVTASMQITGEDSFQEPPQEVIEALNNASKLMTEAQTLIERKARIVVPGARQDLKCMEERAAKGQERVRSLRTLLKKSSDRLTCETLLQESDAKLEAALEAVNKALECENPFLMVQNELPPDETLLLVKSCEVAATSANTKWSIAKIFVTSKLVEAKRFSEDASGRAEMRLKESLAQLEISMRELSEFKTRTVQRKVSVVLRDIEAQVSQCEELATNVAKAASVLQTSELLQLSVDAICEAVVETSQAEATANEAILQVRKVLSSKQADTKGDLTPALASLAERIDAAERQIAESKELATNAESRISSSKVHDQTIKKVQSVDDKVNVVCEMVRRLSNTSLGSDTEREEYANTAVKEAQLAIRAISLTLEAQARRGAPMAEDETSNGVPSQLQAAQEKLNVAAATMRERSEQIQVNLMLNEVKDKVTEAEGTVWQAAQEADALAGTEDVPPSSRIALETAMQIAKDVISTTRKYLSTKKINTTNLAEGPAAAAVAEHAELQRKFDDAAMKFEDIRRKMTNQKMMSFNAELTTKLQHAQTVLEVASEATTSSSTIAQDVEPGTMKDKCQKASKAQGEALAAIEEARECIQKCQGEATGGSEDVFKAFFDQVDAMQSELGSLKTVLKESEHRIVAKILSTKAAEMVDEVERQLSDATKSCAPLISEDQEGFFVNIVILGFCAEALRAHAKQEAVSLESTFASMKGSDDMLSEEIFVSFMSSMPELKQNEDITVGEDELRIAFKLMAGDGAQVDEASFLQHIKLQYHCASPVSMTDNVTIKGGKTIRKVLANEALEALGELEQDSALGMTRLKAKASKDGAVGYVTVSGNQGTVFLTQKTALSDLKMKMRSKMKDTEDEATKVTKFFEAKLASLKDIPVESPLTAAKEALQQLRPRITQAVNAVARLRKKLAEAERQEDRCIEVAKKRHKMKTRIIQLEEEGNAVQRQMDKVMDMASSTMSSASSSSSPLQAIESATNDLKAVLSTIAETHARVKEEVGKIKQAMCLPAEAREPIPLVNIQTRLVSYEAKCKMQVGALHSTKKMIVDASHNTVRCVLREHVQKKGIQPSALLQELGNGKDVSRAAMQAYIENISDDRLKALSLDLALERYSKGVTKLMFLAMVQDYRRILEDVEITSESSIANGKTLRKLGLGEVVEVYEASKVADGHVRVRCRVLTDGTEGWVSMMGSEGTAFLSENAKPYICCQADTVLRSGFESSSLEVRQVVADEIFEVLEGPRKESDVEIFRVRVNVLKDGRTALPGWVTDKVGGADSVLEPKKMMICKGACAITDEFDVATAKALRKLEVGEMLEVLEEAKEDAARNLVRVKIRTMLHREEGWVSLRGNQGTEFLEKKDGFYVCKSSLDLTAEIRTASPVLCTLQENDILEVLEGPKAFNDPRGDRLRGRSLSDGTEGWFTMDDGHWQAWSLRYRCVHKTSLHDQLHLASAQALRDLSPGELVEALDVPVQDTDAGLVRLMVRTETDCTTGFATIRGQGAIYLELVPSATVPSSPPPHQELALEVKQPAVPWTPLIKEASEFPPEPPGLLQDPPGLSPAC